MNAWGIKRLTKLSIPIKCNYCGLTQAAPDKTQHYVQLILMYDSGNPHQELCRIELDFCTESCKDDFIRDNRVPNGCY